MTVSATAFFELVRPRRMDCWGDYGSILRDGMFHSEEQRLDRTGPFVSPISFPGLDGAVIVTGTARQKLEASGLSGVGEFRPVLLGKVVRIDWHKWDRHRHLEREQYPFNGEPEEYILHNPHDPATASQVEPLWTWHPLRIGKVLRKKGVMRLEGIMGRHDVFRLCDAGWRCIIVNERGMECVKDICGDWVAFDRIENQIVS
ncbi:hypothetical protein Mal4_25390 [Maioricimonas rarisocia]|uniref:Uncharacterized protein n=2 Tax=Maioricimonas rarisocia TaxID=2528026 RepID=A0A517Z6Z9_9PLAN|nr:hypothetical protein Mal4_25390 [Maioricimonas rarisocia]